MSNNQYTVLILRITEGVFDFHIFRMTSISDDVYRCLRGFDAISALGKEYSGPDQAAVVQLGDDYRRFRLWSANIGAHRNGRSSLEYRLRDSSHLRTHITKLLMTLNESLEQGNVSITATRLTMQLTNL